MIEVLDYFYKKYPVLAKNYPRWIILSFLDKNENNIIIEREKGIIKGAAIFFDVEDDVILDILNGNINITKPEDIQSMIKRKGNNIHFILCAAEGTKYILRGIKKIILQKKPTSISWWKPDMSKIVFLKLKEGELCHKQY